MCTHVVGERTNARGSVNILDFMPNFDLDKIERMIGWYHVGRI